MSTVKTRVPGSELAKRSRLPLILMQDCGDPGQPGRDLFVWASSEPAVQVFYLLPGEPAQVLSYCRGSFFSASNPNLPCYKAGSSWPGSEGCVTQMSDPQCRIGISASSFKEWHLLILETLSCTSTKSDGIHLFKGFLCLWKRVSLCHHTGFAVLQQQNCELRRSAVFFLLLFISFLKEMVIHWYLKKKQTNIWCLVLAW